MIFNIFKKKDKIYKFVEFYKFEYTDNLIIVTDYRGEHIKKYIKRKVKRKWI